jgi:ABC-type sugar transport system ATPase subunit
VTGGATGIGFGIANRSAGEQANWEVCHGPHRVAGRHEGLWRQRQAVDSLSLDIADGDFIVLVGPSGCGKTTVLQMVAGLEDITSGTITIGDRVVNGLAPRERDIAMVFQNYAPYPHLTVEENLAFGLELHKVARQEQRRRVTRPGRMTMMDGVAAAEEGSSDDEQAGGQAAASL